ncbi:DNA-binding protein [Romboutsia weinsteinii]|uniref:DNA-binding protein n=1 Tax=Romboutsia weinsteinii TaxID=2020949 RepID=A0A371IYH4_9FIRM|nr:Mor transcription activator family protein [Romboutsia weinsteinii]RDY25520.1 DNA-binding protein [Romboutsia weinsteinii]
MLEHLTEEYLPENLIDIVQAIGMDSFRELVKVAGGSNLYIPNENSLIKPIRNKIIKDSFKGDYKSLSKQFGISEVQIRNIVNLKN